MTVHDLLNQIGNWTLPSGAATVNFLAALGFIALTWAALYTFFTSKLGRAVVRVLGRRII